MFSFQISFGTPHSSAGATSLSWSRRLLLFILLGTAFGGGIVFHNLTTRTWAQSGAKLQTPTPKPTPAPPPAPEPKQWEYKLLSNSNINLIETQINQAAATGYEVQGIATSPVPVTDSSPGYTLPPVITVVMRRPKP